MVGIRNVGINTRGCHSSGHHVQRQPGIERDQHQRHHHEHILHAFVVVIHCAYWLCPQTYSQETLTSFSFEQTGWCRYISAFQVESG